MLIQKLEGEKLREVRAGDEFCCWTDGEGCDCTDESTNFVTPFSAWIKDMEMRAQPG